MLMIRSIVSLVASVLIACFMRGLFVVDKGDLVKFRWDVAALASGEPFSFSAYFKTKDSNKLTESKVVRTKYNGDVDYFLEMPCHITSLRLDVSLKKGVDAEAIRDLSPAEIYVNSMPVASATTSPFWLDSGCRNVTTYVPVVAVNRRVGYDWTKLILTLIGSIVLVYSAMSITVINWRWVWVVVVVAVLPWCRLDTSDSSAVENRTLAKFPHTIDMKAFEAAFNDRFFGRSQLISIQNAIKDCIGRWGEDLNEKAHCGLDGWLFYKGTLADFANTRIWPDGKMKKAGDYIAGIADYCKSHGKKFAFIIGPDKCRIYPEKVRHAIKVNDDAISNTERFVAYLRGHYSFPVIYSREELIYRKAQTQEPLYYPMDTHWTHLGAYYGGYLPLMQVFGIVPISVEWESRKYLQMDLRAMNRKARDMIDNTVYSVPKLNVKPCLDKIQTVSGGQRGVGRLFALRDSFFTAVTPFIAATFEDGTLCWRPTLEISDQAAFEAADFIVLELVERNIPALVKLDGNPIPWEVK